jgi:PilZ domain
MKKSFSKRRLGTGSRPDLRRSCPRFAFSAPVEIVNPITKTRMSGHVTTLSQQGCFAEVSSVQIVGSVVQLRIENGEDVFQTPAQVIHNRLGVGVGLCFLGTTPEQSISLRLWLDQLKT